MISVTIDGQTYQASHDRTVLQVAREHGISIPTLCHHEALEPFAACRLCVVEVNAGRNWRLVASCAFPCTDGLAVRTHSERVMQSRRLTVELLMASTGHVPIVQQLASDLGVGEPRFTMEADACILCGLCVRVCREIVGLSAISFVSRGIEKKVRPPFEIASNLCIECGTCVLVCPTGALSLSDIVGDKPSVHRWESPFVATDCRICGNHNLSPKITEPAVTLANREGSLSTDEEGHA
jgi:NADH dehydrogenase/NADH:ubiquinone oxidoreductase subunit G